MRLSEKTRNRLQGARALACALILAPPLSAASADPREYRLSQGDVLQIGVYGQAELSGRYRIGPEGTMSYPLVGAVAVAGRTAAEVAEILRSRLSQYAPLRSAPSVEVAEFAPVFVTGAVEKPGQYPFRPGMIARELAALAGGERRPTSSIYETRSLQLIAAEQAVTNRALSLFASRAQKLRLEAELAAAEFSPDPSALMSGLAIDAAQASRLVENEATLFSVRRKVVQNQIAALQDQRASFDRESETLRAAKTLHDGEIALLEQETANAQRLLDKSLGLLPTLLTLKRQLSATRRDALEIEAYLARAGQQQLEIDKKIQDVVDQQKRENSTALRELEIAIAQTESALRSDMRTVAEIRSLAGSDALKPVETLYYVTRSVDGVYVETKITDLTELAPRDILRAERSAGAPDLAVSQESRIDREPATAAYRAIADRSPEARRPD